MEESEDEVRERTWKNCSEALYEHLRSAYALFDGLVRMKCDEYCSDQLGEGVQDSLLRITVQKEILHLAVRDAGIQVRKASLPEFEVALTKMFWENHAAFLEGCRIQAANAGLS